jgi:Flp pilus assembly protein TadD
MDTHRMFRHAQHQLARGQVEAAIETLATLLGGEPDHADAHGLLAICLVRRRRLHAARLEAERSVALDPEGLLPHLAAAAAASADRRFKVAEEHLNTARSIDPESVDVEIQLAHLYSYWGRNKDAAVHAARAVALAPDDPDALATDGEIALQRGDTAEAAARSRRALETDPEHVDALVLLGRCDLAAGNTSAAREHALWALQLDPMNAGALTLICAVKARESLWLGLWWRFQSFVSSGSGTRAILLLLGMFMIYRVAAILSADAGRQDIANALQVVWLAFAAYTWVAPEWFRRTLRREMDDVRLRPDF